MIFKRFLDKILRKNVRPESGVNNEAFSYIWEGIYQDIRDVPTNGPGFAGKTWLDSTCQYTMNLLSELNRNGIVVPHASHCVFLPLLVSMLAEKGKVRILDVGGGMGGSYVYCLGSLPENTQIEYHIVEDAKVCDEGRRLFLHDEKIQFHAEMPDSIDCDVVFISSVLQYVEDYPAFLRKLCSYRAQYLLLVNTLAGNIPTYASVQKNVAGSEIACWFHRSDELIELISTGGYRLMYNDVSPREYEQGNFPDQYRLKYASDFLFCRIGEPK